MNDKKYTFINIVEIFNVENRMVKYKKENKSSILKTKYISI